MLLLEKFALESLGCSMNTATSTKLIKLLQRHPDMQTSLMQMMVAAMDGNLLMTSFPMRKDTAWLRTACTTTAFTRETNSSRNVKPLLTIGKKKWMLRISIAGSKNMIFAWLLKPKLTLEVSKRSNSLKS